MYGAMPRHLLEHAPRDLRRGISRSTGRTPATARPTSFRPTSRTSARTSSTRIYKRRQLAGQGKREHPGATTSWREQLDAFDRNVIENYKRVGTAFLIHGRNILSINSQSSRSFKKRWQTIRRSPRRSFKTRSSPPGIPREVHDRGHGSCQDRISCPELGIRDRQPQARWYPKAQYAPYVEFGTAPHIIRAVNARVLANTQTGQFFGTRRPPPRHKSKSIHGTDRCRRPSRKSTTLFGQALDK